MKRIYLVSPQYSINNEPAPSRLVRAVTAAQARRHATKDMLTVEVATTEDVADLVAKGVGVEDAKEE